MKKILENAGFIVKTVGQKSGNLVMVRGETRVLVTAKTFENMDGYGFGNSEAQLHSFINRI